MLSQWLTTRAHSALSIQIALLAIDLIFVAALACLGGPPVTIMQRPGTPKGGGGRARAGGSDSSGGKGNDCAHDVSDGSPSAH
jgi:hypothetical protein